MEYFRYLEFQNLEIIQLKVMKIITDLYGEFDEGCKCLCHVDELTAELWKVEELIDELKARDWFNHVKLIRLFALEPKSDTAITWDGGGWPIHTDGSSEDPAQNDYRLVIPIDNCNGTKTRFFNCTSQGYFVEEYKGGPKYKLFKKEDCTEFTHYELNVPVLIYTNHPHSVDGADNGKHRISLGITFDREIDLLDTKF